jgi:hypothetical protein
MYLNDSRSCCGVLGGDARTAGDAEAAFQLCRGVQQAEEGGCGGQSQRP